MPKRKAVFLDRDGVINRTVFRDGRPRAPARVEDFEFLPGVEQAVGKLRDSGFTIIVVTNQPDVARGWQTREAVEAMNRKVLATLLVDEIKVCYHVDADGCGCRKPKPGMLLEAARDWEVDLAASYMIGDRAGDISAGQAAGCATILIGDGDHAARPSARAASLADAAEWIIRQAPGAWRRG